MFSAVILAAGVSRRFGKPKLLLPLGGKFVLAWVLDTLLQCADVGEIILVTGAEHERMARLAANYRLASGSPIDVVYNPDYPCGQSSSLQRALTRVDRASEGMIFVLGDQPCVSSATIQGLCQAFRQGRGSIVYPTYHGRRGNPTIFAPLWRNAILALRGDEGARSIIKNHPEECIAVPMTSREVLLDIDLPEDYEKVRQWLKTNGRI